MDDWPLIPESELRARLALTDEEFRGFLRTLATSVGVREFTEEIYTRALGYPWARPPWSYLLTGDTVEALDDLPAGAADRLMHARWPLLAFGANGAPETLRLKLGHLAPEQQRLLVIAGDLHGFDVGASAHPTIYGALPGTLFPSPGTVVRVSVLWVTAEQLTALAWTELSYAFGRLDGIRFEPAPRGLPSLERVFVFASRLGALRLDGEVVALDAIQASGRQAPTYTQEQLLDDIAVRVVGPGATAHTLVTRLIENFAGAAAVIAPILQATSLAFDSPHWTRYGDAAPGQGSASTR